MVKTRRRTLPTPGQETAILGYIPGSGVELPKPSVIQFSKESAELPSVNILERNDALINALGLLAREKKGASLGKAARHPEEKEKIKSKYGGNTNRVVAGARRHAREDRATSRSEFDHAFGVEELKKVMYPEEAVTLADMSYPPFRADFYGPKNQQARDEYIDKLEASSRFLIEHSVRKDSSVPNIDKSTSV